MADNWEPAEWQGDLGAVGSSAPPRRRRLQFSLASLLWLTTVVACLVALWVTYRQLATLRQELEQVHVRDLELRDQLQFYRGEIGGVDTSDPSKLFAAGGRWEPQDNRWAWRVCLPEKRQFRLCVATTRIPANGVPSGSSTLLAPGGHSIVLTWKKPRNGGPWTVWVGPVGKRGIVSNVQPLVGEATSQGVAPGEELTVNAEKPLVLLRLRKLKAIPGPPDSSSARDDPEPCDGLMIWIEEAK